MKTRTWILIFGAIAALCAVAALCLRLLPEGQTAEIYSQGELIATVDLSRDDTFTVTVDGGENTVEIKDGEIRVTAATCPDQVCVNHGPAASGSPVVCLPNQLVISLTGGDVDAATGS